MILIPLTVSSSIGDRRHRPESNRRALDQDHSGSSTASTTRRTPSASRRAAEARSGSRTDWLVQLARVDQAHEQDRQPWPHGGSCRTRGFAVTDLVIGFPPHCSQHRQSRKAINPGLSPRSPRAAQACPISFAKDVGNDNDPGNSRSIDQEPRLPAGHEPPSTRCTPAGWR